MIISESGFIEIPRSFKNMAYKIEIYDANNAMTDVTSRASAAEFTRPDMIGIGAFRLNLLNPNGVYSKKWAGGNTVKIYLDLAGAANRIFEGMIDFVQENRNTKIQSLDIIGRHVSSVLIDKKITLAFNGTNVSEAMRTLVSSYATGFTSSNVEDITATITDSWQDKPFWDCIIALCVAGKASCYIDDNKDFHFFSAGKYTASNESLSQANLFRIENFGVDSTTIKDKVTVYGADANGILIIGRYGNGNKETVITDNSITTQAAADARALSEYDRLSIEKTQGIITSQPLIYESGASCNPGDMIWTASPPQKIQSTYRIIEIKYQGFPWRSITTIEKEFRSNIHLMKDRISAESQANAADNRNAMTRSYYFSFDDSSNIDEISGLEVSNGWLQLQSGQSNGSMKTSVKNTDSNITAAEARIFGESTPGALIELSADNGLHYQTASPNVMLNFTYPGNQLKARVTFTKDTTNTNPRLDSLSILYKT